MEFIFRVNLFHRKRPHSNFKQISIKLVPLPTQSIQEHPPLELVGKSVTIFPSMCTEEKIIQRKTISHILSPLQDVI